jgi:hypothetical protein
MGTLGFDLFKRLPDGSPLWVGQAGTLDQAKKELDAINPSGSDQYFIREAATGQIVFSLGTGGGES